MNSTDTGIMNNLTSCKNVTDFFFFVSKFLNQLKWRSSYEVAAHVNLTRTMEHVKIGSLIKCDINLERKLKSSHLLILTEVGLGGKCTPVWAWNYKDKLRKYDNIHIYARHWQCITIDTIYNLQTSGQINAKLSIVVCARIDFANICTVDSDSGLEDVDL